MSKKILIIAEKYSLAEKIAKALGVQKKNKNGFFENEKYIVANLVGHILEIEYPKQVWTKDILPINLDVGQKYIVSSDKKDIYKKIYSEIQRCRNEKDIEEICSAGDAEIEGSLLVYELLEYTKIINDKNIKITRVWIESEDVQTLKNTFEKRYPIEEDLKYVEAGKSRGLADTRIGFNLSVLFTLINNVYGETLPIGRVMTIAAKIIYDREQEIEKFIPYKYYNIHGKFNKNFDEMSCVVLNEENKYETVIDESIFPKIKESLDKNKKFKVIEKKDEIKKEESEYLPNMNDIIVKMNKMYKMKSEKIEKILQFLYEQDYITYPRSSSNFLRTSMYSDIQKTFNYYNNMFNKNKIPTNFVVNNKKIFDDEKAKEHYAIIPNPDLKSEKDIKELDSDQYKVYEYIVSKFLMSVMPPYEYNSSLIMVENSDKVRFKINGKIEKNKGFRAFDCSINNKSSVKKDIVLPNIEKNEEIELLSYKSTKKETEPPKLLKEGELFALMEDIHKIYKKQNRVEKNDDETNDMEDVYKEKFSLGTSATRIPTFKKLVKKNLIEYVDNDYLKTTELGKKTILYSNSLIDIETTAMFDKKLKMITEEKYSSKQFDKDIKEWVETYVIKEKEKISNEQNKKSEKEETVFECMKCNNKLLKTDKAYRCSAAGTFKDGKWSGCDFQILINQQRMLGKDLDDNDIKKLLNNESIVGTNGNKLNIDINKPPFYTNIEFAQRNNSNSANNDTLVDIGKGYKQNNVVVWKESYGRSFSIEEAKKLFAGETLEFSNFVSKEGKKYKAKIKINNDKLELIKE